MDNLRSFHKRLIFFLFVLSFLFQVSIVKAQTTTGSWWIHHTTNVPNMARTIYRAIVQISGISALLMIVWGGAEYAFFSTADPNKVEAAKEKIKYAIYGLLIILLSYIMLYVINPELVQPPTNPSATTTTTP